MKRILIAMMLVACGGETPEAKPPMGGADHHEHKPVPPAGPQVKVTLDGKEASVNLADVPHEGTKVGLVQIVKTAMPDADPTKLQFDLVGADGFHPANRPPCQKLLTGDDIAKGSLDVATHDTSYTDPNVTGCYKVKSVVRIDATKVASP